MTLTLTRMDWWIIKDLVEPMLQEQHWNTSVDRLELDRNLLAARRVFSNS